MQRLLNLRNSCWTILSVWLWSQMFQSQDRTFCILLRCSVIFLQRQSVGTAEIKQSLIVLFHPAPSPLTPTSFLSEEPVEVHFCSSLFVFLESATLSRNTRTVGSEVQRKLWWLLVSFTLGRTHHQKQQNPAFLLTHILSHWCTQLLHSCWSRKERGRR